MRRDGLIGELITNCHQSPIGEAITNQKSGDLDRGSCLFRTRVFGCSHDSFHLMKSRSHWLMINIVHLFNRRSIIILADTSVIVAVVKFRISLNHLYRFVLFPSLFPSFLPFINSLWGVCRCRKCHHVHCVSSCYCCWPHDLISLCCSPNVS